MTVPPKAKHFECVEELLELDNDSFVDAAYLSVLGRPADETGRGSYLAALRAGKSKIEILASMISSDEAHARHDLPFWTAFVTSRPNRVSSFMLSIWPLKLVSDRMRTFERQQQRLQNVAFSMAGEREIYLQEWETLRSRVAALSEQISLISSEVSVTVVERLEPLQREVKSLQKQVDDSVDGLRQKTEQLLIGQDAIGQSISALQGIVDRTRNHQQLQATQIQMVGESLKRVEVKRNGAAESDAVQPEPSHLSAREREIFEQINRRMNAKETS